MGFIHSTRLQTTVMLKQRDIPELLELLQSPVTDFDCGTLCAPGNGGVPVCCHAERIVPVLYKVEMAVLKRRSDLWRKYEPRTKDQHELASDMRGCDMLAVCKGAEHCERENRSLACRTFPFEPYLDHDRQLVGLVWNYDFAGTCPLIGSRHRIQPRFIEECLAMWQRMFELSFRERMFYFRISQTMRRSFGQKRRRIPVFTPDGVWSYPPQKDGGPPRRAAKAAPSPSAAPRASAASA